MADRVDFDRRRLTQEALQLLPQAAVVLDERRSRPVWFDGLFLTAAALSREQSYFLARQADLARTLGTGVVEGLMVEEVAGRPTALLIRQGHGLTPAGEPVVLPRDLVVELADVAAERQLERALGRPVRPTPPRETRSGLFVLALRPLEYTAEPTASYPTTIDEPRRLEDSVVREVALLTLIPVTDAGVLGDPRLRRARLAERVFGGAGLDLPQGALPLAVVELAANVVAWLDVWLARREAGLAATDILGLGLASEPVRAAHLRQYEAMLADLLEETPAGFAAAERLSLLPAAGPLPKASIALVPDPATGQQVLTHSFFPPQLPVELTLVPEDEVAAVLEESLMLPPVRLDAPADVLDGQPVMVLVPVPRRDLGRLARELGRLQRPLAPRHRLALAPMRPIELLALVRSRSEPRPAADAAATPEDRAWADLVASREALWFARVRQLAAVDDLLPVLVPEVRPALTAVLPDRIVAGRTVELTLGGRGLGGATSLTFGRDDVSARMLGASDEVVKAQVRLLSSVPPGPLPFTLTTPKARIESITSGVTLAVVEEAPPPEPMLTGIRPEKVEAGATTPIAIAGQVLAGATAVTIEGGDIATAIISAGDSGILAEVKVQPTATPGPRAFTVTTPAVTLRSADFGLSLGVVEPAIRPALIAIQPDRIQAGRTVELTLAGQALRGASSLVFSHRGISATLGQAADSEVTAKVAIAADVPAGAYAFVLTTPRASLASQDFGLALLVEAAPAELTGISPRSVQPGAGVVAVITGRGLADVRDVSFEGGISASLAEVTDGEVRVRLRVPANAEPGRRNFSLLSPRGRIASQDFGLSLVVEAAPPALTGITPRSVLAGTTVSVAIAGRGLGDARELTFDGGIQASITAVAEAEVRAQLRTTAQSVGQRRFVLVTARARLESATFGVTLTVTRPGYRGRGRGRSPAVGGDIL